MDRVRPINTKGMRGAKGTQMLKVKEITKSVKPPFELAMYFRILGNLFLPGMYREPNRCSDRVQGRSDY